MGVYKFASLQTHGIQNANVLNPHPPLIVSTSRLRNPTGLFLRWIKCLDKFQQISEFDSGSVENAIRNQVQEQREVGYVFAGSQPSLMKEMLSAKRPFHRAGPLMFLDKIPLPTRRNLSLANFAIGAGRSMTAEWKRLTDFRLGPASSVQKALLALDSRDILDRYKDGYFFLDPLFPRWIKNKAS